MKRFNLFAILICLTSFALMTSSCEQDPCDNIECQNGGVCLDGTCNCPDGTSGTTCETIWRDKLLGTHNITGDCSGDLVNYDIIITANNNGLNMIYVDKMYYNEFKGTATMTDENSFEFTSETQTLAYGDYILIMGSGVIDGNDVTITYTMELDTGEQDNCNISFSL